jgi:hypothetical protein
VFAQFIDSQLAAIDNLNELKVSLVVLHLLSQRQSEMASVTEADILAHPAVRDGLQMPAITLRPALQMAVARGTLMQAIAGDAVRYFRNDADGRRAAAAFERSYENVPMTPAPNGSADQLLREVGAAIARLESIDFYAPAHDDLERIAEWTARGYTREEIFAALQRALLHPRARGNPHRTIAHCERTLYHDAPAHPSEYYEICVVRKRSLPEEISNLKMRIGRMPTHSEFVTLRDAVGLFGIRAVLDMLKHLARQNTLDMSLLIPLLSESEEALLASARAPSNDEMKLRQVLVLFESTIGLPPSSHVAEEIRLTLTEVSDLSLWKTALEYAARENKKSWTYIKKMILNPSPTLFTPPPVNSTAKLAFDIYRQRVNRQLDPLVAGEINALAEQLTDAVHWSVAFDRAAAANALRWDYIRAVLTSRGSDAAPAAAAPKAASARTAADRKPTKRGTTYRRAQAEFSPEERKAAEERARRELEEEEEEDE